MGIQIRSLSFRYAGASRAALHDIHLEIADGTFCGIIGANGAGKSSLCRTLIGFVPHFFRGEWQGEVYVNGFSVQNETIGKLARQVGFVFQNPFDQLIGAAETAFGEVAFGLEQWGFPAEEISRRATEALAAVGLSEQAGRHPFFMSGGQQQRLAIAAVLALDPSILVLDEGTSQLDPQGCAEVYSLAARLHQEGRTIVVVDHKLDWIARYAQQVVVLHQGQIVLNGPARQVLTDPRLPAWDLEHPTFVDLSLKLKERGYWHQPPALTITEAEAILRGKMK